MAWPRADGDNSPTMAGRVCAGAPMKSEEGGRSERPFQGPDIHAGAAASRLPAQPPNILLLFLKETTFALGTLTTCRGYRSRVS